MKPLSPLAHSKGSYLFVDAFQSAGSVSIDVKDSDVDALVAGAQKFLLGVPGIAFMYVKKELANQLEPLTTGWFSRRNPFAFTLERSLKPAQNEEFLNAHFTCPLSFLLPLFLNEKSAN